MKAAVDGGHPDFMIAGKSRAQRFGKGGDIDQIRHALLVEGGVNLAGAEARFGGAQNLFQLAKFLAEKRFHG